MKTAKVSFLFLLFCCLLAETFVGQNPPATSNEKFTSLARATKLDRDGAKPYHLKIEAQIYDLKGKASQPGTIEEWWLAPNQFRIEYTWGSFHEIIRTGKQDEVIRQVDRSELLLRQLWGLTVSPLGRLDEGMQAVDVARSINGQTIDCFEIHLQRASEMLRGRNYCPGADGHNVRLIVSPVEVKVRNKIGKFGETEVALEPSISFLGMPAISGKVTVLQSLDVSQGGFPEMLPSTQYDSDPGISTSQETAAHLLSNAPVVSPPFAKRERMTGYVLLAGRVNREGKVISVDVMACTNDIFVDAAKDAVKNWKFSPFMRDGIPVSKLTSMSVSFGY